MDVGLFVSLSTFGGFITGNIEGVAVKIGGLYEGALLGLFVGKNVGLTFGRFVGNFEGKILGVRDGFLLGDFVGKLDGVFEGVLLCIYIQFAHTKLYNRI